MNRTTTWRPAAVAGAACVLAAGGSAGAAVVTVADLRDATIFADASGVDTGKASGRGPGLFAGADGSGGIKRSLLEFDVASADIPAGATITGATVTLVLGQVAGSGGGTGNTAARTFGLYDLRQAWGEGPGGATAGASFAGTAQGSTAQAGDATYTDAFYNAAPAQAAPWSQAGVATPGGNFNPVESDQTTITTFAVNSAYTFSSPGLAADVQSWVSGAAVDNGWLLRGDNLESTPTSFLAFYSKDGAGPSEFNNASLAPTLTVTYAVPEPSALAGIALGGLGLVGRRRRSGGDGRA